MHDIKDVVKTDVLTGENPDEKKEAAKAVRTAMMARCVVRIQQHMPLSPEYLARALLFARFCMKRFD